jgi:5-bromo-4-chloroindolyl phosphate hydrolysis protein
MSDKKQSGEVVVSIEVETLANQVKEYNLQIGNAGRETLKTVTLTGSILVKIRTALEKERVKGWQKWCEKHCDMTTRTIRNYVRVAKASEAGLLEGCTCLMDAYAALRKQSSKPAQQQRVAEVSTGTIHDLKLLPETDTVVRVQASKKTALQVGLSEVLAKYGKEVKQHGHLIVYLEIVKKETATKGKKLSSMSADVMGNEVAAIPA